MQEANQNISPSVQQQCSRAQIWPTILLFYRPKKPSLRRWPPLPLVGSCWDRAAFEWDPPEHTALVDLTPVYSTSSPDELAGLVAHRSAGELGGWLAGPLRRLLMTQEMKRSEQLLLGLEGRAPCATLTSVGNDKAASEAKIAGCCIWLTWERKSKLSIKSEFTFRFMSVAEDHRDVQNAVLAKCIQLPLQMSLIN